jgi:hydrogenase nickel incorporation protein HypA/HybF
MHELSLAENVLEIAEDRRRQAHAGKIASIALEIGQLSAVEPEALRFAMDALIPDSTAAGARVEYQLVAGSALCRGCATGFTLENLYDACPHCQSFDKQILAGDKLLIKSVTFA